MNMRAARFLWFAARLATAILLCAWALQRWHWYSALPPRSAVRWCGNCFLGTVGIPLECGVFGVFLLLHLFSPRVAVATGAKHPAWWFMIIGIAATPLFLGFPLFVAAAVRMAANAIYAILLGQGALLSLRQPPQR